jgi:NAD(P)-dependent dehydrogenase (short-subunit alcohol dehydrogenase family)
MRIEDCAAVVTGGASGLGAATARRLARAGAKVAIFDQDRDGGEALAAEIGGLFVKADVTVETAIDEGLEVAQAAHGAARILVNCAGVCPAAKTVDREGQSHSVELFKRTLAINLIGSFAIASKIAARMSVVEVIDGERGVLVNTASVCATDGQIGQAAYAASKAGIVGMTLPIARDLAPLKIGDVCNPAGGGDAGERAGFAHGASAASQPVRRSGRICPAGRSHSSQSDAQRRSDPYRWCDPHGPSWTVWREQEWNAGSESGRIPSVRVLSAQIVVTTYFGYLRCSSRFRTSPV